VSGISNTAFQVQWEGEVTEQLRNTWNDEQEATEFGACAIAILLVLELTPYTIIRRSRKGTGFDYWLGYKAMEKPFQDAARLEISGILAGDSNAVKARIAKKKRQTTPSNGMLPAYIVVVEFSKPLSHVVQK